MTCLTKAHFLQPINRKKEKVDVAECAGYVWLQALGSKDLLEMQTKFGGGDTQNLAFAHEVLAKCIVDDDGCAVFSSSDELKDHLNVSLETFNLLCEKALAISGVTEKN